MICRLCRRRARGWTGAAGRWAEAAGIPRFTAVTDALTWGA
jgi:hypothetical protein